MKRLDDICIKSDLIEATRKNNIPDFDGDGKYLVHYSVDEMTKTLGTPEDDALNTFTARLLLLLESRPLLQPDVYNEVLGDVISAYWDDYEDHKTSFAPAFLTNDILRLWRTFCVNYEVRTEKTPEEKKEKRKLKNYTLKHSRLLTCYSALLYLLFVYNERGTVSPENAIEMISLTPTARIEWLLRQRSVSNSHATLETLLTKYDEFLSVKSLSSDVLLDKFLDKHTANDYISQANNFGQSVFEALTSIGSGSKFHRLLVV